MAEEHPVDVEGLLDHFPFAVSVTASDQRVVYINQAAERLYGYRREDVVGSEALSRIAASDTAAAAELLERIRQGETWSGRFPIHRADGARINAWFVSVPWPQEGGNGLVTISGEVGADGPPALAALSAGEIGEAALAEAESANILLESLLETVPVGMAFFDSSVRYVRANKALADMNGLPQEAHIGKHPKDLVPEFGDEVADYVLTVFKTGETIEDREFVAQTAAQPGVDRHWRVSYYPIWRRGVVEWVGATVVEVSEWKRGQLERQRLLDAEHDARRAAEQAVDRLTRLQVVTAGLAEATDVAGVSEVVVRQGTAGLGASAGALCALDDDGYHVEVVRAVGFDSGSVDRFQRFSINDPLPASEAIRTGRLVLISSLADRDARYPGLASANALNGSYAAVPLLGRRGAAGAIAFGWPDEREFDESDRGFMLALARQAAQALERARLYESERRVSRTLQESLLPPLAPAIPGLEVAARYHSVGDGTDVGGDFYDVFPLGDGRWAVVMGDVCGKGVGAASLTALARYTVRAAAIDAGRPTDVLHTLNRAVLEADIGDRFCTIAHAVVEPYDGGARVVVSSAGHPLPVLLTAAGDLTLVGSPGLAIGLFEELDVTESSCEIAAGDALIFFTDGFVEVRAPDGSFAPDLLYASIRAAVGLDAEAMASAIEAAALAFEGGRPRDDMALLIVRVPPAAAS